MNKLSLADVVEYVEREIGTFHARRLQCFESLNLKKILKRKNPYLFKAKNILTADRLVKDLVDAYVSSSEEGIFGDWLEGLAIFVNTLTFGGWKSGIPGIDLEFDYDGVRYIVAIKSGPSWGNSGQIRQMIANFKAAKQTLRTSNSQINVRAVNGCCYGRNRLPDRGVYFKYCGQAFWEFISGNTNLYRELIEPLGHKARERNDDFQKSYAALLNMFVKDFIVNFCDSQGNIDWDTLVKFNCARVENAPY